MSRKTLALEMELVVPERVDAERLLWWVSVAVRNAFQADIPCSSIGTISIEGPGARVYGSLAGHLPRRRSWALLDSDIETAAGAYRGDGIVGVIAVLGVGERQAWRYVRAARERGLLPVKGRR